MTGQGFSPQRGFTLLELTLVLLLLAILGGNLFLRGSPGATTLNVQADQLARALRNAQFLALAQGRRITFDVRDATRYALTDGAAVISDPQSIVQRYTLSSGAALAGLDIDFDGLGRPIDAAGNLIAKSQTWTLSAGHAGATVSLSPLTGFVAVTP